MRKGSDKKGQVFKIRMHLFLDSFITNEQKLDAQKCTAGKGCQNDSSKDGSPLVTYTDIAQAEVKGSLPSLLRLPK